MSSAALGQGLILCSVSSLPPLDPSYVAIAEISQSTEQSGDLPPDPSECASEHDGLEPFEVRHPWELDTWHRGGNEDGGDGTMTADEEAEEGVDIGDTYLEWSELSHLERYLAVGTAVCASEKLRSVLETNGWLQDPGPSASLLSTTTVEGIEEEEEKLQLPEEHALENGWGYHTQKVREANRVSSWTQAQLAELVSPRRRLSSCVVHRSDTVSHRSRSPCRQQAHDSPPNRTDWPVNHRTADPCRKDSLNKNVDSTSSRFAAVMRAEARLSVHINAISEESQRSAPSTSEYSPFLLIRVP